jgi:rhombotail lipoprotein
MRLMKAVVFVACLSVLAGCASVFGHGSSRQAGSLVDYLYPDAKDAPNLQPEVTRLRLPVRVGVVFVPGAGSGGLSEAGKAQLLERVKASFSQYEYIGGIEIIPSSYLRPRGGFNNLDQVARMFNVDVVAMLSYDQVKFNDTNRLAVLYWTVVGAYIIKGDKYDIQTMVDAAVFDVKSRKLLFRAPGTSQVKGLATLAGYSEQSRAGQTAGYNEAVDQMIPQLQAELGRFKERVKSDPGFAVEHRPGYKGGGSVGWLGAVAALAVLVASWRGFGRGRGRAD